MLQKYSEYNFSGRRIRSKKERGRSLFQIIQQKLKIILPQTQSKGLYDYGQYDNSNRHVFQGP